MYNYTHFNRIYQGFTRIAKALKLEAIDLIFYGKYASYTVLYICLETPQKNNIYVYFFSNTRNKLQKIFNILFIFQLF